MDSTIGYITLNNINKTSELIIPYILIFLGLIISIIVNNIKYKKNINLKLFYFNNNFDYKFEKVIQFTYLYIFFTSILIYFNVSGIYKYLTPLVISAIIVHKFNFETYKYKNLFLQFVSYLLLIIFCISQTNYYPVVFIIIIIYSIVLYFCGTLFFSFMVLLFTTKLFFVGPTIIGDAFHLSEHFLASSKISLGLFKVFPNIGYLEEYPPYLLIKILSIISNENIQISLGTSRIIVYISLLPVIAWYAYKVNKYLSALLILAIPTDRISLLIALVYTTLLVESYKKGENKLFTILSILIPYILLGLSPSYFLIPLLALIILFPFGKLEIKNRISILISWLLIIFISKDLFLNYYLTYLDLSKLYQIGFSTSISILSSKDFILWSIFTLVTSVIIIGTINNKNLIIRIIKSILIIILLYKFVSYGYGRIDPGFTRLFSLGIPLIYVSILLCRNYQFITGCLLALVLTFYSDLNFPNKINLSFNSNRFPIISLDDNNKNNLNNINNFSAGRKVINYSNEPALSYFIDNSLVPPFTTPYVTLGARAQNDVINFIKNNPDAVIYLGHSFITFDGIDIRLRTPMVFKFLSENYTYVNHVGNIYAVPNSPSNIPTAFNLFFNSMDIKKSALYFTRYENSKFEFREVFIDCSIIKSGRFQIWAKQNFIFADLNCGKNLIPDIFLRGDIINVEKI